MSEEIIEEEKIVEKKPPQIFTEWRGEYVIVNNDKFVRISFPHNATLDENLEAIEIMKKAILDAVVKQKIEKAEENDLEDEEKPAEKE